MGHMSYLVALSLLAGTALVGYAVSRWLPRHALRPSTSEGNPGVSVEGDVTFGDGGRTRTERFNMVHLLAGMLEELGYSVESHSTWLEHRASGLVFQPRLVEAQPLEGRGIRTVTTIEISHPDLALEGVFEYQHATGDNVNDSIKKGLEQWVRLDLPVLLDASRQRAETCVALEKSFPAEDGAPDRIRRVLLGPVEDFAATLWPVTDADIGSADHPPSCSCCLFTHTMDAFESLVESDKFYAIRLYAGRDPAGAPLVDSRVNGHHWEEGAEALREYVKTWPQRGVEFRKQYVVVQTLKHRVPVGRRDAEAE